MLSCHDDISPAARARLRHAHIAPDVTHRQLAALLEMRPSSRTTTSWADAVTNRHDKKLVGMFIRRFQPQSPPTIPTASGRCSHTSFVGEVSMDRRTPLDSGRAVFWSVDLC